MGFNRRKMEVDHKAKADAAARRFEDAERLIDAWNERLAKRMPMRFSPTIDAAIAACQANDAVSLAKDHYWSARR
jgi:hypothetical protein